MSRRLAAVLIGAGCALTAAVGIFGALSVAAGSPDPPPTITTTTTAAALNGYVEQVEAVRLPVNRLLEEADPILDRFRTHRVSAGRAAVLLGRLESRFAGYTLQAQQIQPTDPVLAALNRPYAHTYLFEDAYLAALTAGLHDREFDGLPHTQDRQRLAIVTWRVRLEALADRLGVVLPADIQQAGRGEIAPAPTGS